MTAMSWAFIHSELNRHDKSKQSVGGKAATSAALNAPEGNKICAYRVGPE